MPTKLSAHDKYTIQLAAHGVVALMASSAPGALTAPRAGIAAAKAMSTATGLTGEVLAEKPPKLPFKGSVAKTAELVLPALAESVRILDRTQQGEGENFRRTMQMVAESAAHANGNPTPAEAEMLRKVEEALREVQRSHHVGWRTVRDALDSSWPTPRAAYPQRASHPRSHEAGGSTQS